MHTNNQQALIALEGHATYERILSAVCSEEPDEATRQIQNFLRVYPEFAQAHNDLAVIFYRVGNHLKALAHYEKAHKLEPRNITFRKNLADFYAVELDWNDEARHIYLDILKDNPFDVETLVALGTLNQQSGRKEQARQFFSRALELDPLSNDARQALQLLSGHPASFQPLHGNSLPEPAGNPHENIMQPVSPPGLPPSPAPLHEEAMMSASSGLTDEAIELLEKLVSLHPSYAVAHNDLGVMYQQSGNGDLSRKHHEQAVLLCPDNLLYQKNLAELLTVCFREYESALGIYTKLLESYPGDIEVLAGLTRICMELGKNDDARTFLKRILSIEPWNIEARETLSQIEEAAVKAGSASRSPEEMHEEAVRLSNEGRAGEARAVLEKLVSVHHEYAVAHNDLGVLLYQEGDIEGARQAYERAVGLQPSNTNFRKNLADLYFVALDRSDNAIRIYLEIFREQPRDVETLAGLGHISAALNRPEEAKTFYRRALEVEPWNMEIRNAIQQIM